MVKMFNRPRVFFKQPRPHCSVNNIACLRTVKPGHVDFNQPNYKSPHAFTRTVNNLQTLKFDPAQEGWVTEGM